jgi:hypothetical protein
LRCHWLKLGIAIPSKIAIIEITTINSVRAKPEEHVPMDILAFIFNNLRVPQHHDASALER